MADNTEPNHQTEEQYEAERNKERLVEAKMAMACAAFLALLAKGAPLDQAGEHAFEAVDHFFIAAKKHGFDDARRFRFP